MSMAPWPISWYLNCKDDMMTEAFICDYVRTPIGRFGGALSSVRADDLGAVPLKALMERHAGLDFEAVDDVIFGCANQAGEDNRNVARMSLLLAGLPLSVGGTTINRLCGSGMDAVIAAARAINPCKRAFSPESCCHHGQSQNGAPLTASIGTPENNCAVRLPSSNKPSGERRLAN